METLYDWLSVAVFAGLVLLYLQRSVADEQIDTVWHYLPPAIGCALSNSLGNEGYSITAVMVLVGSVAYIVYILRPTLPSR